jgi:uncharacterized protein YbbC (DUF1343 family)
MRSCALALVAAFLCSCSGSRRAASSGGPAAGASAAPAAPGVLTGIDVLEADGFALLKGKRVGLITNPTGKDRSGRSTAELLAEAPGVSLVALFTPEHGITGKSEDINIASSTIMLAGREIPIHSLYGGGIVGMRPKEKDLETLDVLVFDIQDIGARFYTYLATMGMALEESAKAGIDFVVLDRPNPINGQTIEGPILDDLSLRKLTPTAYFAVPVRHGMTAGEIARMHNKEVRGKLTVVPMENWDRGMWYDDTKLPWTPPSPNMPDLDAATLYPGVAIFETANVSVGRGTPKPFRWIGAPWIDGKALAADLNADLLDGVQFSAQDYKPSKSVYAGELCRGVLITVTDRESLRPLAVFRKLDAHLRARYPDQLKYRWDEVKRMVGTDEFHRLIETGGPDEAEHIQALFDRQADSFRKTRQPFLLY